MSLSGLATLWNAFTNFSNRYDSLSDKDREQELAKAIEKSEHAYNSPRWKKTVSHSLQIVENRVPDFIMADITNGIDRCWNQAHDFLKRPNVDIMAKRKAMNEAHYCICEHIKLLLSNFGGRVENLPTELRDYISDLIKQVQCVQ